MTGATVEVLTAADAVVRQRRAAGALLAAGLAIGALVASELLARQMQPRLRGAS